ncbi:peptidylprolyl isomerase [Porcipelethomonas sp.]|uniref:peptidylprolyl isomerase n=1 Tax=Porcipelethomonas sp. TaxID=2981675 RepID=UPI003EF49BF8
MINLKKLTAAAVCCMLFTAFAAGCGDETKSSSESKSESSVSSSDAAGAVMNFTPPEKGEEIAVITIKDYGDIKVKLFPEQADKGVENFVGLSKDGYYDGLIFHRIIKDFMIQGGDPLGNGTGGESMWGDKFDGGTSDQLSHVAGAVAYANSGSTATDGSQFYIVTGTTYDEASLAQMESYYGITFSDEQKKIYQSDGGAPWLDGSYTIFGQVFDGLDIVFDIQNVDTDESDKPQKDVVIEKISIEKYDGEDVKFHLSDY